ncbi:MAG TPA: SIR2 family protein [Candidatus Angelobacter sp.]|nr:SIR2 family protein [Candidatus Angelobacter sp.]
MVEAIKGAHGSVTFVLGAGASRSVSYAGNTDVPSPLDRDFFDLLQRLEPQEKDEAAVGWVLEKILRLPFEYRRSLERAFYTLHMRSYLRRKLTGAVDKTEEEAVVSHFARAIVALLRKAHGTQACKNHERLLQGLGRNDAVISFNYDLVVERALRQYAEMNNVPFVPGIYHLDPKEHPVSHFPKILKLHGSVNWRMKDDQLQVRTTAWDNFDDTPGYRSSGEGTRFPIFLPFWDKQVTRQPWLWLWQKAHQQLKKTEFIIVWGFSMATTDVKARELFNISIPDGGARRRLCVIDPSQATRDRWRELLPSAQYWEYDNIKGFLSAPPPWWWNESLQ